MCPRQTASRADRTIALPPANQPPASLPAATASADRQTELGARLAAFAAQNPDVPVFVAAPGTVEYQKVMDTMALVQAAGVPKVSLMSQPGGNAR